MPAAQRRLVIPAFGLVKGGACDGWRFHFLRFVASDDGRAFPLCRMTPPHWPFPRDLLLRPGHYGQLRAIPGSRAKRLDAIELIRRAFVAAARPVPTAWLDEPKLSLKRAARRTRKPAR